MKNSFFNGFVIGAIYVFLLEFIIFLIFLGIKFI